MYLFFCTQAFLRFLLCKAVFVVKSRIVPYLSLRLFLRQHDCKLKGNSDQPSLLFPFPIYFNSAFFWHFLAIAYDLLFGNKTKRNFFSFSLPDELQSRWICRGAKLIRPSVPCEFTGKTYPPPWENSCPSKAEVT